MESREPIDARLRVILAGVTGLDPQAIDSRTPLLRGGLELDSLSVASLMSAVEAEFGIDLLEEDLALDSLASLHALAAFIRKETGG
jgi:acyl carrier protein